MVNVVFSLKGSFVDVGGVFTFFGGIGSPGLFSVQSV